MIEQKKKETSKIWTIVFVIAERNYAAFFSDMGDLVAGFVSDLSLSYRLNHG